MRTGPTHLAHSLGASRHGKTTLARIILTLACNAAFEKSILRFLPSGLPYVKKFIEVEPPTQTLGQSTSFYS